MGDYEPLLKLGLGGMIFFSKDINSESDFKNTISDIKQKSLIAPFLSIDQEGGRVERTENIYPCRLSMQYAYAKGNDFLKQQTEKMADELQNLGLNLNFAPCCDVNSNPNNPIIGERAFSNNADDVINGATIVFDTYKDKNIIPCIKHFPGHGDADTDSHKTLPIINLTQKEMEDVHIKPFKTLIDYGADMVMVAHLHCTCFDKEECPTSLSKSALGYLRKNLGFKGVAISDDMVMKGIKYPPEIACVKGIEAGIDMFIYRSIDDTSIAAIEGVIKSAEKSSELRDKIELSYNRIINLKQKYGIL